ncbi:MAG: FtsX-like permease family protein [Clostridia bacterium]|nr:FtsX-like permease family protein [Clostridia bacterium]
MLRFVLRKMANKKWMVFALLIGNILLVSITCSNAMYGKAVLQRTLTQELANYLTEKNSYPGQISLKTGSSVSRNYQTIESGEVVRGMPEKFGIPAIESVEYYHVGPARTEAELERKKGMAGSVELATMMDIEDHITIVAGTMYSDTRAEDGTIDVIVSERGVMDMNLLMGECFRMPGVLDENGEPLRLRVCGVFRNSSDEDVYWVRTPSYYGKVCFMADEIFNKLFMQPDSKQQLSAQYFVLLDYTQIRGDRAQEIRNISQEYFEYFGGITGQTYRAQFDAILKDFLTTEKKVNVTLWVLQVPIFVLLAAFIFMVSREMLDMEQNEIAVLKSRGASKKQIITTYLIQSGIVALIAFIAGIPLGSYLVQVLGSANAFLEFVKRSSLPVEITEQVIWYGAAAALFAVAAMVIPVFRHSNVTIVNHKQKKHRKSDAPLWQRIFLDVAVLAVSLYGLYTYNGQKELLAQRVMDGASLDPLLFMSSSLFMIGAGLFALRVLPVITFVIFRLFKRWWSPALYAAFLRVIRTRYSQSFIMVFLILTIALGVFNAQAARTINTNEEDNIRYGIGADLVIQEKWEDNSAQVENDPSVELMYIEPDFSRFELLDGVEHITKVLWTNKASMNFSGGNIKNLNVMGIHTKTFGETAWFKDGILPHHINEYLNAMATNSRAVLVSRNFGTVYGFKLGDAIYYRNAAGDSARGIIYGFVDYWPGYQPLSYTKASDGLYKETQNYLVVANLNQLQASWGVTPYEIWIDAKDSTSFMYDFAEAEDISFMTFEDMSAKIVELKNDPVFQGTNGILTVGFIVVLILCSVGFLIYWILSIKSRSLQFGIYRAMGMSMREIITMLLGEQVFISGTSIAVGALVGWLTSWLYMPLIQMAYAAYDSALPLRVISERSDMIRLLVIVGAVMMVCMMILGWLISKMKIAQALKLGED